MKTKIVSYTLQASSDMSAAQRKRLAALANRHERSIDTSDIAELSVESLATAERGRFYRPLKQQITARIDADVLAWLKADGKGYQGRMNAILRREMLASMRPGKQA